MEPAAVTARTLEEAVAEDGLDGVQADGAGLREAELRARRHALGRAVVWTVGPGHSRRLLSAPRLWDGRTPAGRQEEPGLTGRGR